MKRESVRITSAPGVAGPLALERISVDLPGLLETALRPLAVQARARGSTLSIERAPHFPKTVFVDGFKLAWVVTTLVGNALRFATGAVGVSIRHREPVDEVVITVRDDGPGIPATVLESLLSREMTIDRVPSLNLLLVEDIVRAHGGTLEIATSTDAPDCGTCVTVRLPGEAAGVI